MMSFFCIFGKHLLSLVMLACRTPRGSIFVVATRDYLLLALTNQPSAALWESSSLWHSFGDINVPSSQAVLWLRTAIAVFLEEFFQKSSSFFVVSFAIVGR